MKGEAKRRRLRGDWRAEVMMVGVGGKVEQKKWGGYELAAGEDRDRGITEDGGSAAALMCGRWVDGVIELWLRNGS